jgi:hypothetical protein
MEDCFALVWSYYGLQLGVLLVDLLITTVYTWLAKRHQRTVPSQAVGDRVFWQAFFLAFWFSSFLTYRFFPCEVSGKDAEFVLFANYLLIANHLFFAAALLHTRISGPLVHFSFIGGALFLIGAAASGAWPHPKKGWLFWAILVGSMGSYLGVRLRVGRRSLTSQTPQ